MPFAAADSQAPHPMLSVASGVGMSIGTENPATDSAARMLMPPELQDDLTLVAKLRTFVGTAGERAVVR